MSTKGSSREMFSLACYALALTLFLGAVLFVMVGVNKKQEDYGNLPWYYAGTSLVLSLVFWRMSTFLEPHSTEA